MTDKDGSTSCFGTGFKGKKDCKGNIKFYSIVGYRNENYKEFTWMEVADLVDKLNLKK